MCFFTGQITRSVVLAMVPEMAPLFRALRAYGSKFNIKIGYVTIEFWQLNLVDNYI